MMSTYLKNAILNAVLRGTTYTATTGDIALYTSNPDVDDSGIEVAAADYSRKSVTFTAPALGVVESPADVDFDIASSDWGIVTHIGIKDSSDNLLFFDELPNSREILSGDQFRILASNLSITLEV